MYVCNYLNISVGTVMKNSEILKFIHDHFKIKKMCKYVVKIFSF